MQRRTLALAAALFLSGCVEGRQIDADALKGLQKAAYFCSFAKLDEYSVTSSERADQVAKSAFNACFPQWDSYNKAECARLGGVCDPVFERALFKKKEGAFIDMEMPRVIELRQKRSTGRFL